MYVFFYLFFTCKEHFQGRLLYSRNLRDRQEMGKQTHVYTERHEFIKTFIVLSSIAQQQEKRKKRKEKKKMKKKKEEEAILASYFT